MCNLIYAFAKDLKGMSCIVVQIILKHYKTIRSMKSILKINLLSRGPEEYRGY